MGKVTGLLVKDGECVRIKIQDKLEEFYKMLGCDLIDIKTVRINGGVYDVVCDDEGLFDKDAAITMINDTNYTPMLVGNLFICKSGHNGELASLSDEEIRQILVRWSHKTILANWPF